METGMENDEDSSRIGDGYGAPLPRQRSTSLSSWTPREDHFGRDDDDDDSRGARSPDFPSVTDLFGPTATGLREAEAAPPLVRGNEAHGRQRSEAAPRAHAERQESRRGSAAPPQEQSKVTVKDAGVVTEVLQLPPQSTPPELPPSLPPPAPGDGYVMVLVSSLRETAAALAELEADVRAARAERCVA
jgi:hypothetical protein